jgi:hypothetical protein
MLTPTLDDLLHEATWLEWRESALSPSILTDLVSTEQSRAEFVEGARLLRLDRNGKHVLPHQLLVSDMLNAGHESNAALIPRRSTKTTSILAVVLGRCTVREDYQAAMSLTTTAAKTSERFDQDVMALIERSFPEPSDRPCRVYRGKGAERLEFPNGSRFSAKSPNGDAFRSGGYDFVLIDESGEATPEQGEDLNGAILSTFDTRPGAQIVYAGTAGRYRSGNLLWDALQDPDGGKIGYAFPEDATEDELAAWEPSDEFPFAKVRELVEASHPGVHAGLTPLETVRRRFHKLRIDAFTREYGSLFGDIGSGRGIINAQKWAEQRAEGAPAVPDHFALAVAPAFNQSCASMVAAWRDESGRACGYVIDHRRGTTWISDGAASKARQHNVPIIYDSASNTMRIEVEALQRMTPRPRLEPQTTNNVTAAAALLVREINAGNARHWGQEPLNDAARVAVRRSVGPSAWALGRPPKDADADLSAMEAWALALRHYDDNPARAVLAPIMAA